MTRIDRLLAAYSDYVGIPWASHIAGPERTWFVVYEPQDERRLRRQMPAFEMATKEAGRGWLRHDLLRDFADWLANEDYREAYFEDPTTVEATLEEDFLEFVADRVRQLAASSAADEETVIAVHGTASLFGLLRVSDLVSAVVSSIPGRLVVFFPGSHDNGVYRHLDATDGWNYLAVPITVKEG